MMNKEFSERLSHLLDQMGVPSLLNERKRACAKLFKITSFNAGEILEGSVPKNDILERIAIVLGVNGKWLISKEKKRKVN